AGIAALGHDRGRALGRELEDRRDLGDRARPQHHRAYPAKHVARLGEIGRLRIAVRDGVFLPDDRDEAGEEIGGEHFWRRPCNIHRASSVTTAGASTIARHLDEFPPHGRGAAARSRRSLIASPSPSRGTGITAMVAAPAASSARRWEKRLAAASMRSPRAERLSIAPARLAPGARVPPNARRA